MASEHHVLSQIMMTHTGFCILQLLVVPVMIGRQTHARWKTVEVAPQQTTYSQGIQIPKTSFLLVTYLVPTTIRAS